MNKIHRYYIRNNKYVPQSGEKPLREVIIDYLQIFQEGDLAEVVIRKHKKQRSNSQNRYMHYVFNLIADETGNDMEDIKVAMKQKYLGYEEKIIAGEIVKKLKSTTELNTTDQEEFMDKVRHFWLDFIGLMIPLPNEVDLEG